MCGITLHRPRLWLIGMEAHAHRRYSVDAGQVRSGIFSTNKAHILTTFWSSVFRWEYPFFAAWDTAFHCIPLAVVDPAFAKKQLDLMTREWYMKPDGQIPAYEWNFSDVNPPVHAWYISVFYLLIYSWWILCRATFRIFKIERKLHGREDLPFLERVFQKLLLNFTWCDQFLGPPPRPWMNFVLSGG